MFLTLDNTKIPILDDLKLSTENFETLIKNLFSAKQQVFHRFVYNNGNITYESYTAYEELDDDFGPFESYPVYMCYNLLKRHDNTSSQEDLINKAKQMNEKSINYFGYQPFERTKHRTTIKSVGYNLWYYKLTSNNFINLKNYTSNHFLNTILLAYNKHLPLHLKPDDIWLVICSIITEYINFDPEFSRKIFVNHDGKKNIIINLDSLMSLVTQETSIWDLLFESLANDVKNHINSDLYISTMKCAFTTTTQIEYMTSVAYILDTVKEYFTFHVNLGCGIPSVYLHGDVSDWELIIEKTKYICEMFANTSLASYLQSDIMYILKMLLNTKNINDNSIKTFWSHIISHTIQYGSGGGTFWDGWIMKFFPYICRNNSGIILKLDEKIRTTVSSSTNVPLILNKNGIKYTLTLRAGCHGSQQFADGSVSSILGYYLIECNDDDIKRIDAVNDYMFE